MIKPQIDDDEAPANYYRALRDVAAWMAKNAILSAESLPAQRRGHRHMDIGLTQLNVANARSWLNGGTTARWGSASARSLPPASCTL